MGALADHAERLLILKNIKLPFRSSGDSHNSGDCQIQTAQQNISELIPTAFGESLDNRIAREKNPPGREPLVLKVTRGPHTIGAVSYRGRNGQRFGDDNPMTAYQRMVGMTQGDPAAEALIQKRRLSVNDLVRGEMKRLLCRQDLSMDDRHRLEGHFTAIRALIIALGDDRTDEDLFAALPTDAIAVKVGPGDTRAGMRLGGVPDVHFAYDAVYLTALSLLQARENTAQAVYTRLREVSRPDSASPLVISGGSEEFKKAVQNVGADFDYEGAATHADFDAAGDVGTGVYRIWEIVETPAGLKIVDRDLVSYP